MLNAVVLASPRALVAARMARLATGVADLLARLADLGAATRAPAPHWTFSPSGRETMTGG